MGVLLGVIVVIVVAFNALRPDPRLPDPVDYSGVVDVVQDEYSYDIAMPSDVPEDWRATSVDHRQTASGNSWRLGFLVEGAGFVGLEQSDGEIQSYLADRLGDFEADGRASVDGTAWQRQRQTESPRDHALVLEQDGVVTIVRGTESYDVLERFAANLTWTSE